MHLIACILRTKFLLFLSLFMHTFKRYIKHICKEIFKKPLNKAINIINLYQDRAYFENAFSTFSLQTILMFFVWTLPYNWFSISMKFCFFNQHDHIFKNLEGFYLFVDFKCAEATNRARDWEVPGSNLDECWGILTSDFFLVLLF
jgi:hypothetical protein